MAPDPASLDALIQQLIDKWRTEAADDAERASRAYYGSMQAACSSAFIRGQREYAARYCDKANELAALLLTLKSQNVYADVRAERNQQDTQWGGLQHDDQHPPEDWIRFIRKQVDAADNLIGFSEEFKSRDAIYRQRMVKVAALAVAAIEALDRFHSPLKPGSPPLVPADTRTEARRLNDIAEQVVTEWDEKWKYPLAWETRQAALKRLIADALRECSSASLGVVPPPPVGNEELRLKLDFERGVVQQQGERIDLLSSKLEKTEAELKLYKDANAR